MTEGRIGWLAFAAELFAAVFGDVAGDGQGILQELALEEVLVIVGVIGPKPAATLFLLVFPRPLAVLPQSFLELLGLVAQAGHLIARRKRRRDGRLGCCTSCHNVTGLGYLGYGEELYRSTKPGELQASLRATR